MTFEEADEKVNILGVYLGMFSFLHHPKLQIYSVTVEPHASGEQKVITTCCYGDTVASETNLGNKFSVSG